MNRSVKQVIIVRRDLLEPYGGPVGFGKFGGQVAHASGAPLLEMLKGPRDKNIPCVNGKYVLSCELDESDALKLWIEDSFTKVVLSVKSEEALINLHNKILAAGFISCLITDNAKTVFSEPTITCLGVEPLYAEQIDPLTKKLQLLKV